MNKESIFELTLPVNYKLNFIIQSIDECVKNIYDNLNNLGNHSYFIKKYYPELDQCYSQIIRKEESDFEFFQKIIMYEINNDLDRIRRYSNELKFIKNELNKKVESDIEVIQED